MPKTIGNETAKRLLLKQYAKSYSWLICGEKGIGKFSTIYNFAQWLLQSNQLNSIDCLVECAPKIEAVRNIKQFLSLTPSKGLWKIVIIDDFDKTLINAANALLKILEEPMQRGLIFLVTHKLGGILPTINSRCRKLVFTPLSFQEMRKVFSPEYYPLIPLAGGSPGILNDILTVGGLELYEKLVKLLGQQKFFSFSPNCVDTIFYLIQRIFLRLVRIKLDASFAEEIFAGEIQLLKNASSIKYWENKIQILVDLFYQADKTNLNKQDILNTWLFC